MTFFVRAWLHTYESRQSVRYFRERVLTHEDRMLRSDRRRVSKPLDGLLADIQRETLRRNPAIAQRVRDATAIPVPLTHATKTNRRRT